MTRILFLAGLAAVAASGCATQTEPHRGFPPAASQGMASPPSLPVADDEIPGERWWLAYGDPQLNDLIDSALNGAPRAQLTTGLVRAYGEFWRLTADRDAAEARARNRAEVSELAASRRRDGAATDSEVRAAEAAAALALQTATGLDREVGGARQHLAALAGIGQGRDLALRPPSARRAAFELPPGRIEQLLSRRPDLQAARWRAAVAEQGVEIARSGAGPRPTLFAFLDRRGLSHLVRSGSDLGQARLAFRVSSLERDDVGARIEAAEADRDAAAAAYARAHLGALRDVAAATASEHALDRQLSEARTRLAEREAAYQAIRDRYAAGLVNRSALLAAEEVVIRCRGLVAGLLAKGMIADAALVDALGGGIGSAPAK
jgi:outer membrane protein TolC